MSDSRYQKALTIERVPQRRLHPLSTDIAAPVCFPSPFNITPHPLAQQAAKSLQALLPALCVSHNFKAQGEGKMIGVLVVRSPDQHIHYLAAFSGMLGKQWECPGFVPPVFDQNHRDSFLTQGEKDLQHLTDQISQLDQSIDTNNASDQLKQLNDQRKKALTASAEKNKIRQQQRDLQRTQSSPVDEATLTAQSREDKRHHRELKQLWKNRIAEASMQVEKISNLREELLQCRRGLSNQLHQKVFKGYAIPNFNNETQPIAALFNGALPPGGAGDCAAVKLLHYCIHHQLEPLCVAEFWWGDSPAGGVRHHAHYYPACRGKCGPLLPYMLCGIDSTAPRHEQLNDYPRQQPEIVFEDNHLMVVNKPEGMLSVPGKVAIDSVEYRLRQQLPVTDNANLLVHRLDQATSGLLLAAKNAHVHKHLQQQFEQRKIDKRYCALLEGLVTQDTGTVDLPLRVDIDDRPRQMVCEKHGKASLSHYRVIERNANTTRVEFSPVTGRTHQLRIHAAHPAGLNTPILGDELYGNVADRLYLHAAYLAFQHPVTGDRCEISVPAPF